jgi:hypothetical protein
VKASKLLVNLPEILVDAYLDAHGPPLGVVHVGFLTNGPAIAFELLASLNDHLTHQLAFLHEGGTQVLRAGPSLGTATVEIDAAAVRGHERGCAGELLWHVGAELDNGGRLGSDGRYSKVWKGVLEVTDMTAEAGLVVSRTAVSSKAAPVELLGQYHGCPAQVGAIVMDSLTEG